MRLRLRELHGDMDTQSLSCGGNGPPRGCSVGHALPWCLMKEKWRWIEGYEGIYKVSNIGRVKSVDRVVHGKSRGKVCLYGVRGKILRPGGSVYAVVPLYWKGRTDSRNVHSLVCRAFNGPPPSSKYEVNHKDGDKFNNRAGNLEWMTRSENVQHAVDTGLRTVFYCPTNGRFYDKGV